MRDRRHKYKSITMAKIARRKSAKLTKDGFEHISIWQVNVGDLVSYLTSPKVYIIANKSEDTIALVSATQQFNASYSFDVKRLLRADEINEENYNRVMEKLPYSEKNVTLSDLQAIAEEYKQNGKVSTRRLKQVKEEAVSTETVGEKMEGDSAAEAPIESILYDYTPSDNWNADRWFDKLQDRLFRTEKEVETKFILPLLTHLGYSEDDRYDGMIVEGAEGSKKISLETDFVLFANDVEELANQPLLIVEAKKEFRLNKAIEIEKAQRQARSYAIWTGCKFGLITDSRIIQVLDIMPNFGSYKILFECQRVELKERFVELYNLVGREKLKDFYAELI